MLRGIGKAVHPVIQEAEVLGFRVARTRNGHLKFTRPGCRPVFTGSTPSDSRSAHNAIARLRQSRRGVL